MEEIGFVNMVNRHLRVEGETVSDFYKELKKLTTKDKEDLSLQAEKEFGYKIKDK